MASYIRLLFLVLLLALLITLSSPSPLRNDPAMAHLLQKKEDRREKKKGKVIEGVSTVKEIPGGRWGGGGGGKEKEKQKIFRCNDMERFDEVLAGVADENNNIMIAYTNSGFHHMTQNFLYYLNIATPPIKNILLFPLECDEFQHSQQFGVSSFFVHTGKKMTNEAVKWHNNDYYKLVQYKWKLVSLVLERGYNVMISDVDIIWLRNPFKLVETMPTCDFTFYCAKTAPPRNLTDCMNINTGFMYFRAAQNNLNFIDYLLKSFPVYRDDQTVLNKILKLIVNDTVKEKPSLITPNILHGECGWVSDRFSFQRVPPFLVGNPRSLFGDAETGVNDIEETQTRPYGIHFNYLNGLEAKLRSLRQHGFWNPHKYRGHRWGEGEEKGCEENFFRVADVKE